MAESRDAIVPSLTRLPNSLTGVVLLVPCLLICLACVTVTPFPIEKLEVGMTAETVRENFGYPEVLHDSVGESSWTYPHVEAACEVWGVPQYDCRAQRTVLYFEEGELTRWVVLDAVSDKGCDDPGLRVVLNCDYHEWLDDEQQRRDEQERWKDRRHHEKGHNHHHGH